MALRTCQFHLVILVSLSADLAAQKDESIMYLQLTHFFIFRFVLVDRAPRLPCPCPYLLKGLLNASYRPLKDLLNVFKLKDILKSLPRPLKGLYVLVLKAF